MCEALNDNEIMSMHAEIRRGTERKIDEHSKSGRSLERIEQEIEERSMSRRSLEPVEKVDIGVEVRCAEALQQLCQTQTQGVGSNFTLGLGAELFEVVCYYR